MNWASERGKTEWAERRPIKPQKGLQDGEGSVREGVKQALSAKLCVGGWWAIKLKRQVMEDLSCQAKKF